MFFHLLMFYNFQRKFEVKFSSKDFPERGIVRAQKPFAIFLEKLWEKYVPVESSRR